MVKTSKQTHEISIIMRTHNSEKFVKKALESALNQTLPKKLFEIMVVDDGSTDRTREILKSYNKQIWVIEKNNLGPIPSLNLGIKEARGKYVILLDSDDIFELDILENLYSVMINNKDVAFVYSDYFEYNKDTKEKKLINVKNNIFDCVAIGILFKKEVLNEVGLYDENLIFPEYDLLIKIMKKYKNKYIGKPLFTYVRHSQSITANKKTVERGMNQLYEKYGKKIPIRQY